MTRAALAPLEAALFALARTLGDVAFAIEPVTIPESITARGSTGSPRADEISARPEPVEGRAGALIGIERLLYEAHRSPRRRAEFLAGRIAARRAAAEALRGPEGALEIGEEPSGAPVVKGHPALRLSISHSHGVAVAVAAAFAVGVDLERDEPRPEALARFFFTAEERDWLAAAAAADRQGLVNLLWTRKEAASKVGRWGGRLPFASLDCSEEIVTVCGRRIALRSARAAGYALSVAGELRGG